MFIVGLIPSIITVPLRWLMPESPRLLASKGRLAEANNVVSKLENEVLRRGGTLPEPVIRTIEKKTVTSEVWRELFTGIYRKRTFTIWALWVCGYTINNGLVT